MQWNKHLRTNTYYSMTPCIVLLCSKNNKDGHYIRLLVDNGQN